VEVALEQAVVVVTVKALVALALKAQLLWSIDE
jgi:hypothetical protein